MATTSHAPTSSTTSKTMSSPPSSSSSSESSDSISESGHSSPNSSGSDSPLVSFDHTLDSTDPLNVFLNTDAAKLRSGSTGDLSTDDSLFSSTPPSSHDSPVTDWSASASGPTKDTSDQLWQHPDLSLFSFDGFNSSGGMDFSMGFDSMLFPSDPLFSMNSNTVPVNSTPVDLSSFTCNFGQGSLQSISTSTTETNDRQHNAPSSTGIPLASGPQAVMSSLSNVTHGTLPASQPASDQGQTANGELMNELAAKARQLVGLTMALPFNEVASGHAEQTQDSKQYINAPVPMSKSSAPSETQASASSSVSPAATPAPTSTRTKTSHTTIERRYRTNLNARIQSLRAAVPALRVLEVKQGNRVGNLSLKAGTRRVGVDPDAQPGQEDVIDERGYIDGVKVARKGSKANVLGKAVEYIHVLKRREMRLKREQEGLKALIRSLVGGPELVQQWEKMWRERFGGPEKDEVSGDDAEADDENDDGEDDDEEEDEAGASGRKRKRAKADQTFSGNGKEKKVTGPDASSGNSQSAQSIPIIPSQTFTSSVTGITVPIPVQQEKRKRGRPRKVALPPLVTPSSSAQRAFENPFTSQSFQQVRTVAAASVVNGMQMEMDPGSILQASLQPSPLPKAQPSQQYLLAAFAFFSFFNSPLSYTSGSYWAGSSQTTRPHTHTGSVLGGPDVGDASAGWGGSTPQITFTWRDAIQITHLAVSILLLFSIVAPWFPGIAKYIPRVWKPMFGLPFVPTSSADVDDASQVSEDQYVNEEEKADASMRMELLSALSKSRLLAPATEAEVLREVLGLRTGILGLMVSLTRQLGSPNQSRSRYGLERRMLEQKAFLRFAELVAMDVNAPITTRLQTYLYSFRFFSVFSASVKDISTLALVIRPIWRTKSTSLWSLALSRAQGKVATNLHVCKPYETYVLESMSVEEAAEEIAKVGQSVTAESAEEDDENQMDEALESPLALLAKQVVRDFIREHSERVFLYDVTGDDEIYSCTPDTRDALRRDIRRVVDAGRSLDDRTARLVDVFERVCKPSSSSLASDFLLDTEDLEPECTGSSADSASNDVELYSLLRAIVLYRRIFPSTNPNSNSFGDPSNACRAPCSMTDISLPPTQIPSPPPSPSRRDAALHLALRRCLDSSAFDRRDGLEDARDRVVDMLTAESSAWPKRLRN